MRGHPGGEVRGGGCGQGMILAISSGVHLRNAIAQPSVVVSSSSENNNRLGSSAFYHSRLEIFEVRRVFRK